MGGVNVFGGVWVFILLALYFLPTMLAVYSRHRNATGIGLLNFFLGWTVLGWIGALIWSVLAKSDDEKKGEATGNSAPVLIAMAVFAALGVAGTLAGKNLPPVSSRSDTQNKNTLGPLKSTDPKQGPVYVENNAEAVDDALDALIARAHAKSADMQIDVVMKDGWAKDTSVYQPTFTLTWRSSDLSRVNWTKFERYSLLNSASVRVDSPQGTAALNAFCGPSYPVPAATARAFCKRVEKVNLAAIKAY